MKHKGTVFPVAANVKAEVVGERTSCPEVVIAFLALCERIELIIPKLSFYSGILYLYL